MTDSVAPAAYRAKPTSEMASEPTVLVLGGTGFLGQALVERLLRDGVKVRALVREFSARANAMARLGAQLVKGDLADGPSVEAALLGIQQVYHLARAAGTTWEDYLRYDVEPTRRLAELCGTHGIRLYYTSSIAIYDGGRRGDAIVESTPPSPASLRLNAYARAKAASERMLVEMHRDRGLKVVIFRPGIVIGRGGNPRHPGVGAWPDESTCRPWGGGGHRLPFVLVDDCVDAMVRALDQPGIDGQSFNLVGDAPVTGNEYLDALERWASVRIRRAPRPAWRLYAQSVVRWGFRVLSEGAVPPLPSYRYCDGLSCRAVYRADLSRQRLGWSPISDAGLLLEQGLATSVRESSNR
jgi:nucleoside-diphosphate-sugar epimerase